MKKIIIPIFFILFLLFPYAYSISNGVNFILGLLIIAFVVKLLSKHVLNRAENISNNKIQKYYPLIIFSIALITRIISAIILNDNITQVSDFKNALQSSCTLDFNDTYHRLFTHWLLLPLIVNNFFKIFGNNQIVVLIFSGIICSIVALLIYFVTKEITKNKNISLLASIIYIFWPANILYIGIYTPEHITQLLLVSAVLLIFKGEKSNRHVKKYILFFASGVALGLTTFFKNFGIVFIIALAIYYFLKIIFERKTIKEILQSYVISLALVVIGSVLITNLTYIFLDHVVGAKVSRDNTAYFLAVGLNKERKGSYNKKISEKYISLVEENNFNYNIANKELMNEIRSNFKFNKELLDLLNYKARILVQNDEGKIEFIYRSALDNGSAKFANFVNEQVKKINNFYYMIVFILIGIGIIRFKKNINLKLLYIYISVYGSYLLLLIIEVQNRYTYSINPFLCILAALGLETLLQCTIEKKSKKVIY